jgi:competence protein ComEC
MKNKIKYIVGVLICICVVLFGGQDLVNQDALENNILDNISENTQSLKDINQIKEDDLKIYFIDVGQADCILLEQNGKFMLIDAGNNDDGDLVVNYLKEKGVQKLDYIIATHAHEDHIGGMDNVINSFDEDKILFPKSISTTKTFEDFVIAVKNKNKKLYSPKSGESFTFANSKFEVLAPNADNYEDVNNYSIVIRLTYKENSFLFTGDAEKISEQEILNKGYAIKSDLIKIGHHGSSSSTSDKFLKKVNPDYAVICVGKDNSYNLPKKSVMDRLKKHGVKVYRTDEQGCITATSDGKNITFDKSPATYNYMK